MPENVPDSLLNAAQDPPAAKTSPAQDGAEWSVEPHVLTAALVLVAAAVCDALTLLDPPEDASPAPCSMRVSSIVAVLALAAPRIVYTSRSDNKTTKGFALADQRAVLALPLCAFALAGLHRGSEATRLGDTLYSTLVLLGAVYVYSTGGIESEVLRPDDVKTRPHRRQTVSGLRAALFVYVGLRGVRSAFVAADEVPEQLNVVAGYAQISIVRVMPLAFGHGTLVCVGALIATSERAHVKGSSAVAFEVGMAGIACAVAALWATLAHSEIVDDVPILYGSHACAGARGLCAEAYASRRFAEVNASEASLWLAALAAMLYAASIEVNALVLTRAEQLFQQQGFGSGALLFIAAVAALYTYGSLRGASWYVDACAGVVLAAIFVSTFAEVAVGALLAAIAFGALLYQLDEDGGAERESAGGVLLLASLLGVLLGVLEIGGEVHLLVGGRSDQGKVHVQVQVQVEVQVEVEVQVQVQV